MLRMSDATKQVKEYWVSVTNDNGFLDDVVFDTIISTHTKDATKKSMTFLKKTLNPTGYDYAVSLMEEYSAKRHRISTRYKRGKICGERAICIS